MGALSGTYDPGLEPPVRSWRLPMRTVIVALISTLATLVSVEGRADRRIFGYTYPYQTLPQGTLELEHYLDAGMNGWENPDAIPPERDWTRVNWRHQVEFEYGITDRLDFGFYNVFSQAPYGNFRYDGVKLRSRYRFAEQGQLPVDPAIYLEVAYLGEEVKTEEILILSKRIGRLEIAFNAKVEQAYNLRDKEWEFEAQPLLGIGYHFNNQVALGLEYVGKLEMEEGELEYVASYAGPALSVAGGPFYWTVAVQPQLGARSSVAALQVRSLFGAIF